MADSTYSSISSKNNTRLTSINNIGVNFSVAQSTKEAFGSK